MIIEPIRVDGNQEDRLTIPNWPPPVKAIRYRAIDCGNGVIRTEAAEILEEPPALTGDCAIMHNCPALDDALCALGL